jgi:hypothetical protein
MRTRPMSVVLAGTLSLLLLYGWASAAPAPSPMPSPPAPSPAPSPAAPSPAPSPAAPSPAASPAAAAVITVSVTLAQEVPAPRPETPRTAGGTGAVVVNAARTEVGFVFTYSGTSGPVMQAHFHRGTTGEAGPVVQTICGEPAPVLAGACPSGNSGTVAGVWRIPQAMLADWQAGRLYVNFHTAMNPGGEIRGQITPAR